jgi:hypothetical protein
MTRTDLTAEQIEFLKTKWIQLKNERRIQLTLCLIFIPAGIIFGFIFLAISRHSDFAEQLSGISFCATLVGIIGTIFWLPKSTLRTIEQDFRSGQKLVGESSISKFKLFGLRVVLADGTTIKKSDIPTEKLQTKDVLRYEKSLSGSLILNCKKTAPQHML